jgi:hypothetical protein
MMYPGTCARNAAQQQLAIEKARVLDWNTRTMSERLDAYRHGTAWRGALFVAR